MIILKDYKEMFRIGNAIEKDIHNVQPFIFR